MLVHVLLDLPLSILPFVAVVVLFFLSLGLAVLVPFALACAWLLFVVARGYVFVERSRLAALLDVDIPPPTPLPAGSWWTRMKARLGSGERWREIAYIVLLFLRGTVGFAVTVAAWSGSLALLLLPAYVSALPGDSAKFWLFELGPAGSWIAAAVGLVGIAVVAPWLTLALGSVAAAMARWLLGPNEAAQLAAQLSVTEASRAAAVDSAEAERRRIERDLHDGAQQRLVALAMDLGTAREQFDADPAKARQLVAEAHEEAKAALQELRDLIRGIHPAILADRGLDAALSAVVARCPIPVSLTVKIDRRPSPPVESTAYFVVAEALTNVTKHADATWARVTIERHGDRLIIEVADDGRGGAVVRETGGLGGLQERVQALGGWMRVVSPPGGPTTVLVELPCGS